MHNFFKVFLKMNELYQDSNAFDLNLTKLWLEDIFDQINQISSPTKIKTRPILVEIDLNTNNSDSEYLITILRNEINISFQIFDLWVQIALISLYVIMIFLGFISNSFVIYAFCRSKGLRTFSNFFIVNLAIR